MAEQAVGSAQGTPNFKPKTIWTEDCLYILRGLNSATVDLIYLDPPFNSKANYAAPVGSEAAGAAFKDTWSLSDVDVEWINLMEAKHPALYRVLLAAMTPSDKSYLAYMAARLLEMHRVLKPTGSIYLHCDPTMGAYLKLLMDAIFGRGNFRNEIVWAYRGMPSEARRWQQKHDVLLFYTKGEDYTFNVLRSPPTAGSLRTFASARRRGYNLNRSKRMVTVFDWKKYQAAVDEGEIPSDLQPKEFTGGQPPMRDWWEDIRILGGPKNKERLDYPTQKPEALLRRVVLASSNEGDIVLDPFCGCATTLVAAEGLERKWLGVDVSPKAAELVVRRIKARQGMFRDITPRTDIPLRTDLGPIPPYNSASNKRSLYGEQGGICNGCATHFRLENLEIDHIIARRKGGTDHISNLQLLCGNCNRVKGDRGMAYLRTKLRM